MKSAGLRPARVWLVWLLVPVILAVAACGASGRRGGDSDLGPDPGSGRPSSSPDARGGDDEDDSGGGPGIDLGVEITTGGGSGSGGGGSDSGGDGGGSGSGGVEQPPESDPTADAFQRVRVGSCLPVHRTGRGSAWNVGVPPEAVSCRSRRAGLFRVTRTGGSGVSCEAGEGRTSWRYHSRATGATKLCLERVWVERFCILGNNTSDGMSLGTTTAVDCRAERVPKPYDHVLVVSGVYRAPSDAGSTYCRKGSSDRRTYWSLVVADRTILVCFTYPNS
ncbi:hypothetical protein [Streptomyces sp. rh34]|uniref:hypothetical protein n=1 Tax=Streptomyces sp. rh34 TaxID=2034272 RepID=UPI000BF00DB2|nr:hypothetical protein [Streptomyces sp. rh34]